MENENPKLEIDDLVNRYAPDDDVFEIVAPLGDIFKFKCLPRYGALKQFRNEMFEWASSVPIAGSPASAAHIWRDHLPTNVSEALAAYTISTLSVEPKFSHLDALRLLRAGNLVQFLIEQIERKSKTMESLWLSQLIEDAKKNCEMTTGDEHDSP